MTAHAFASRRGFTYTECAAIVCVGCAAFAVVVAGTQPGNLVSSRAEARRVKDASNMHGIVQAFGNWLTSGPDHYPLPSWMDRNGTTVPGTLDSKDTTANIFSMLIYNGAVSTGTLIAPVECNPSVKECKNYQMNKPKAAIEPDLALWDPAFSVDFTNGKTGSLSYAHLQPAGKRLARWKDTFSADEVVLATRAPEIKSVTYDGEKSASALLADPGSFTLKLYGQGKAWSGHAAFNDCHVAFAENKIAHGSTFTALTAPHYTNSQGQKRLDTWCYDEPDDPEAANNFLGIFTKAGPMPADFTAIWD